jgi:hypothetical protein
MNNPYTDCPECGHHRSVHNRKKASFTCDYAFRRDALSVEGCECSMTQVQIDAHIASFDNRVCETCGLSGVSQKTTGGWSHGHENNCLKEMGKKIQELERELFSRRTAIRDQKERNNG